MFVAANAGAGRSALGATTVGDAVFIAANAAAAQTALSLVPGTNVQAYSSALATYAGIAPSANVQTLLGAANFSAFRGSLGSTTVGDAVFIAANAAAARTAIGTVIGTDVQAYNSNLTAINQALTTGSVATFGGLALTGNQSITNAAAAVGITLNGYAGTAGGAVITGQHAGTAKWALGSASAIIGGSNDPDLVLYSVTGIVYIYNSGKQVVLNAGNISSYALPLAGGAISGAGVPLSVNSTNNTYVIAINYASAAGGYLGTNGGAGLVLTDGGINTLLTITNGLVAISGGALQARVAESAETSGSLTTASANKQVDASGGITIPASTFAAGDMIAIYAGASSRTITQGSGLTQRLHGSATTGNLTLAARGMCAVRFISATECVICGDVS